MPFSCNLRYIFARFSALRPNFSHRSTARFITHTKSASQTLLLRSITASPHPQPLSQAWERGAGAAGSGGVRARFCDRILLTLLTLSLSTQQLLAQTTAIKYIPDPLFSTLSRKGTPKDMTRGGGKRSICLPRANPDRGLSEIVPSADIGGLSSSPNPALWVYQPYTSTTPLSGVLSVRVADSFRSTPSQKVPVTLPAQPGLVRLQLPEAIATNQMLAWTLTVVCDDRNLSRNPFISGLVMVKPNPELTHRLSGLSKSDRAVEYARSGYWYDALDLTAEIDGDRGVERLLESVMERSIP